MNEWASLDNRATEKYSKTGAYTGKVVCVCVGGGGGSLLGVKTPPLAQFLFCLPACSRGQSCTRIDPPTPSMKNQHNLLDAGKMCWESSHYLLSL